jgi:TonB family protein
MEEMRGGVISSATPPGGSSQPSSSPGDVARSYAENGEKLFSGGQVDEALAVVNEGLRAVGDEPSLNNLKRRLERAKQLLDKRSTVAADPLGPTQKRSQEPEALADRGAQLVRMPSPVYPAEAASKGSTTVWVEVQVDERGAVSSARAVRGPSRFYSAAVNATRQAVFRPAVRNGRSAGDKLVLPIMFNPG